ncbi:MAG: aromatic amino acid lyase [Flavobacteriales bacterium]|nr:aromatic amino acid lyase [Flavobacteriales bacterium]
MPVDPHPSTVRDLSLDTIVQLAMQGGTLRPHPADLEAAERSFLFLQEFARDKVIYGINTGFGPLVQYHIPEADSKQLQYNLVRSHASGMGAPLPDVAVRAAMLSRAITFLLGYSGVSPKVIERLLLFLEHGVHPTIPQHGGVGASGDLVQQAHLGLALIGEGTGMFKGARQPMADIHRTLGIEPLELLMRDGLAIVNGTACMSGIAAINVHHARKLVDRALAMGALISEVVGAYDDHLSAVLNGAKRHAGQNSVASALRDRLNGAGWTKKREEHLYKQRGADNGSVFKDKVQEHYSIRCIPQVLGPIMDTVEQAATTIHNELLSVDDNPVVDHRTKSVYHGGNFHGDQVALAMDQLKLAITKLTMLTERQLNFLLNDKVNGRFPPFLVMGRPGIDYGLQGIQFTAVSTTAENQALSTSLYVHSIPNNNDNQDIVSMGTNAAWMTARVIDNAAQVMAIQCLALAQAADIAGDIASLSPANKAFYDEIRAVSPAVVIDAPSTGILQELKTHLLIRIFLPHEHA